MSFTGLEKALPPTNLLAVNPLEAAALQAAAPVVLATADCDTELRVEVVELFKQLASGDFDFDQRQATVALLAEILFPGCKKEASPGSEPSDVQELAPENPARTRRILERMDREEGTFATRLRDAMEQRGITQAQLAEKLGIGQPAISMMLQRQCRPQRRTVDRLAEALGIAATDLWPREIPKVAKGMGVSELFLGGSCDGAEREDT